MTVPVPAHPSVQALATLDRATVERRPRPVRVLQYGAGGFLRAFVDWAIQRANDAGVTDAGVAVVKATPRPDTVTAALRRQDGLFHVLLDGVDDGVPVRETTLVDCVQQVVSAHDELERYRALYLSPDLRVVVSNTTEAGLVWADDDLAARPPASFPAKVAAMLHDRWRHHGGDPAAGLVLLPCELVEANGATLRELVLRHAAAAGLDPAFAAWVEEACSFHDTLVDRIVPGVPAAERARVQAGLGFRDEAVVAGERYLRWAITDPGGRVAAALPLHRAVPGVELVDDVRPVRETKVRVLNGAHTALSAVGLPAGATTVDEACADPLLGRYLRRLLADEVVPTVPGDRAAAQAFAAATLERFANPALHHRLADIALHASAKWRARSLPVWADRVRAGGDAPLTAFGLAALLTADGPAQHAGAVDGVVDGAVADAVAGLVRDAGLGADLTERLAREVADAAGAIRAHGVRGALAALLGDAGAAPARGVGGAPPQAGRP
ncbi:tagaturonate reductase [Puerhibacterium sp. TATVAM-FAB25]|uniref:tagaturonate reductase n=1 Tax=Puerhibacterium sp. TATVAM-FAB25 TaxID=3093699 RepID=UPI00397D09E6